MNLVKTKNIRVIVGSHDLYEEVTKLCEQSGIIVNNKSYDVTLMLYVFVVEATIDQAFELLRYTNKNGGLLLKGE